VLVQIVSSGVLNFRFSAVGTPYPVNHFALFALRLLLSRLLILSGGSIGPVEAVAAWLFIEREVCVLACGVP